MATTFLAPDPIQGTFFIPGGAVPGNGVQVFCYAAGSTTKTTVYKDNAAATPWTNPIVLDSGGNLPAGAEVWISQGTPMKFVYAPSNDTDPPASPYRTLDNISGINDLSASFSEWITGPTPTFINATSFSLVGDQTSTFTKGRRVKTTNTGGTVYSTIVGSVFAVLTTVTIVNDSGSLDAGLSAVSYGFLDPANVSAGPAEIYRKGANVSSATNGTTDIWGVIGDYIHVTGTTGIRSFSSAPYAGAERTVIFDGALTVFSSAALTIPGNANYSTAVNDRVTIRADTTANAIITNIARAATQPLGINPTRTVLTAGSATYTTPVGAIRLNVRMVGGGGGGSGRDANNGLTGTSTTFGTLTASGGGGGTQGASGGAGGAAAGGDINIPGGGGGGATQNSDASVGPSGGVGGNSAFGGGAVGVFNATGGTGAANSGGGGGGAGGTGTVNSGAGGGAGGYVEKLFVPASSTYAYIVGAGGGPGAAGGQAGGPGAAGIIIIDEYYQ